MGTLSWRNVNVKKSSIVLSSQTKGAQEVERVEVSLNKILGVFHSGSHNGGSLTTVAFEGVLFIC